MENMSLKDIVAVRALDWLVSIVVGLLILPVSSVAPYERFFVINNETSGSLDSALNYPHTTEETVHEVPLLALGKDTFDSWLL